MLRLSLADLPQLLERDSEACVSIYVGKPTDGDAAEAFKGRYRALAKKAEALLGGHARLQTKTRVLASLRDFGASMAGGGAGLPMGVALFASPSFLGWFPLPTRPRSAVFASNTFHIRPVLPYLNPASRWFALVVGEHRSELFRCAADASEFLAHCSIGAEKALSTSRGAEKLERWVCDRLTLLGPAPLLIHASAEVRPVLEDVALLSTFARPFVDAAETPRQGGTIPPLLWPLVRHQLAGRDEASLRDLRKDFELGRATTRPEVVVSRLKQGALKTIALSDQGFMRGRVDWRAGSLTREQTASGFGDCVLDDIVERALRERCRVLQADPCDLPPGALLLAV